MDTGRGFLKKNNASLSWQARSEHLIQPGAWTLILSYPLPGLGEDPGRLPLVWILEFVESL